MPVFIYIMLLIPQATIKFLAWLLTHTFYKIHVYGRENMPEQGGAILVPNHISWLDGLLLFATSSRQVRMLIDSDIVNTWRAQGFAKMLGGIPVKPSPKSTRRAIETAREALKDWRARLHFPEGGISRSGQLQRFKPGVLEIQRGTGAPIIPVYLDELWGSIFSFRGGRFFWKWPTSHAAGFRFGSASRLITRAIFMSCGKPCRTWAPMRLPAASGARSLCPGR